MQEDFINRTMVIIFLMAQARRRHTRRLGSRNSGFRKKAAMVEEFSEARLEHFRMMVLRGEAEHIFWHIQNESRGNLQYMERLLEDEGVGVAPSAAEILALLVKRKIDIGKLVPALERALENPYAKENAARTLAAYHLKRVNVRKLEAMLKHKDPVIRQAAEEVVSAERSQNSETE